MKKARPDILSPLSYRFPGCCRWLEIAGNHCTQFQGKNQWKFLAVLVLIWVGIAFSGMSVQAQDPQTTPVAAQSSVITGTKGEWSLARAAEPYRGTTITAPFITRPSYEAAIKMIPEFEKQTGIKVKWESIYYEQMRQTLGSDLISEKSRFDIVLIDLIWIGEFASAGWVTPLAPFCNNPLLKDPQLDLNDFFPNLLEAYGTWNKTLYGLPFDSYSGLLYYNKRLLKEAGFDRPPETWQELKDVYAPALTKAGQYAFALQSAKGETQSCDSILRFVWAFGGSLLTSDFKPNLSCPKSLEGLKFRQELMRYMPEDVVDWDHEQTVDAFAKGKVAMITEWSGLYEWLVDPKTSKISDCLGIAMEPAGPAGRKPPIGGFSLGVNARSSPEKRAAAWLFIQWLTSKQKAHDFILAGGAPGRRSAYEDQELKKQFPYFEPLVTSWGKYGNPIHRPRFQEWPPISRIISNTGLDLMRGKLSVEQGAKMIDDQIYYFLYEAGYYKDKPKLQ